MTINIHLVFFLRLVDIKHAYGRWHKMKCVCFFLFMQRLCRDFFTKMDKQIYVKRSISSFKRNFVAFIKIMCLLWPHLTILQFSVWNKTILHIAHGQFSGKFNACEKLFFFFKFGSFDKTKKKENYFKISYVFITCLSLPIVH